MKADIRDAKAMRAAVERAVKNSASSTSWSPMLAFKPTDHWPYTSEEDWNNVIDINVKGTATLLRAALPHMLSRSKYGRYCYHFPRGRVGMASRMAPPIPPRKWGLIGR